ncbi:MAG: PQQ-dependent sugar dehydrogenase [Desulfobacterales bacterium]|nr:PQQ-dependent sugar dehydrogenase [Desulfobacterales bacterium]
MKHLRVFVTGFALAGFFMGSMIHPSTAAPMAARGDRDKPFVFASVATFDEPWAMTFLPDGRLLVTEKAGRLLIVSQDGKKSGPISGVPAVDHGGQGGLGDVILHPGYSTNGLVYLSYAEAGDGGLRGAAVARAKLAFTPDGNGKLVDLKIIWRQEPKVTGRGHFGHRLAFSPENFLFITSGERQKFTPAQDMNQNLGKIIRLTDDGSVPSSNPFADRAGIAKQIWTLGHRNPLGLAFDAEGRLWSHEMGPRGGDELNLIKRGDNYGWPIVSDGNHYNGRSIPDHSTRPEFTAPKVSWTPVISPAGFIIYAADMFPRWKGSGFIGGLSSEALIRVVMDGETAYEAERFTMGRRIREVEQGPDGAIWVLEDETGGRLLKLTPNP